MSTNTTRQSSSPRRRRLKQNRNPEAGMRNRQKGLFKKTHTWYRYYGGDVLIFIRRPDGRLAGYESHPGLLTDFAKLSVPAHEVMGPDDFDTITERSITPNSTSQSETPSLHTSSGPSSPASSNPENPFGGSPSSKSHRKITSESLPSSMTSSPMPSPSPSRSPSPVRKKLHTLPACQTRPIPLGLRRAVLSFGNFQETDKLKGRSLP